MEGVSSSRSEFCHHLNFLIYIETDQELRLKRGIERGGEEILPLWQEWMAEEDEYVLRDQPQKYADLVLSGNTAALLRISSSFQSNHIVKVDRSSTFSSDGQSISSWSCSEISEQSFIIKCSQGFCILVMI